MPKSTAKSAPESDLQSVPIPDPHAGRGGRYYVDPATGALIPEAEWIPLAADAAAADPTDVPTQE